jgi:hypothetical protein
MSEVEVICPKCGGGMRRGALYVSVELSASTQQLSHYLPSTFGGGGIPSSGGVVGRRIFWEERTGEKKGFILKREKRKKIDVTGLRCIVCGFIEIFAPNK